VNKYVLVAILLGILSIMVKPAHAVDIEYHPRFGAIPLDDDVRAAIQKFPDVASCLKPGAVKDGGPDLDAIDWHNIRNAGDAKICLFMIFEQLGGPEPVKAWLGRMKFKPFGPIVIGGLSRSRAKYFGYEYAVGRQQYVGVTASWSLEGQYPIFPTRGVWRYITRVMSTGQTIGAAWFPDGKLMQVSISYNTIFN